MQRCRHNSAEGITIARVIGAVRRHTADGVTDRAAAIGELHALTTDPHLLAHGMPGSAEAYYVAARELLTAAGADPAVLDDVVAERDHMGNR